MSAFQHCERCGRRYDTTPPATPRAELLMRSLDVAVFMATADLQRVAWCDVEGHARVAAAEVAAHGDDLEFGGKHCKSTFAALARGLAALSFAPGGVVFGGSHWCAHHPDASPRTEVRS